MVDGDLPPSLKKDAHDIILEFIRSRPPLKPVRNPVKTGSEILLKTFINVFYKFLRQPFKTAIYIFIQNIHPLIGYKGF